MMIRVLKNIGIVYGTGLVSSGLVSTGLLYPQEISFECKIIHWVDLTIFYPYIVYKYAQNVITQKPMKSVLPLGTVFYTTKKD